MTRIITECLEVEDTHKDHRSPTPNASKALVKHIPPAGSYMQLLLK